MHRRQGVGRRGYFFQSELVDVRVAIMEQLRTASQILHITVVDFLRLDRNGLALVGLQCRRPCVQSPGIVGLQDRGQPAAREYLGQNELAEMNHFAGQTQALLPGFLECGSDDGVQQHHAVCRQRVVGHLEEVRVPPAAEVTRGIPLADAARFVEGLHDWFDRGYLAHVRIVKPTIEDQPQRLEEGQKILTARCSTPETAPRRGLITSTPATGRSSSVAMPRGKRRISR
jgi:hypothetical protein